MPYCVETHIAAQPHTIHLRRSIMKGFREFIMRGNVIELAVAVIIGAAFTSIVDSLVKGIFDPLIAAIFNQDEINEAVIDILGVRFGIGLVIAAVINFLLIALVVYFVIILPMNKFNDLLTAKKNGNNPDEPGVAAAPTETELLAEIRDLLAERQGKHEGR